MGCGIPEINVPETQQTQDDRHVFAKRGVVKMLVHGIGPLQKGLKALKANRQGGNQPNGAPYRITTADPIPENEHVGRVNAKGSHCFFIGGDGDKMLGDGVFHLWRALKTTDGRYGRSSTFPALKKSWKQ